MFYYLAPVNKLYCIAKTKKARPLNQAVWRRRFTTFRFYVKLPRVTRYSQAVIPVAEKSLLSIKIQTAHGISNEP
jgi:hypothetical protein